MGRDTLEVTVSGFYPVSDEPPVAARMRLSFQGDPLESPVEQVLGTLPIQIDVPTARLAPGDRVLVAEVLASAEVGVSVVPRLAERLDAVDALLGGPTRPETTNLASATSSTPRPPNPTNPPPGCSTS